MLENLDDSHCNIISYTLRYKPEGRGFETCWDELLLSMYLILSAALGPGVYSASNRNEYVREADKLTAICEPTVYMTWDP
jgi:hypothetical protein